MFQWAARGCDKKRCMKIALNSDLIISSLLPQFFEKSERVDGDGGVGTTRIITLGSGIYFSTFVTDIFSLFCFPAISTWSRNPCVLQVFFIASIEPLLQSNSILLSM